MMAIIYASIMMLWFWGSKRKDAFFVSKFFSDIKTLPQLLYAVPPTKKSAANGAEAEEEPQRLMVVPTKQMVGVRALNIALGGVSTCLAACQGALW